ERPTSTGASVRGSGGARRALAGIFVRRESWHLSWRGKLFVLLAGFVGLAVLQRSLYPWLAVTHRVSGDYLVVEGWIHTRGFEQAAAEFKKGQYRKVLTSGCVASDGSRIEARVTYADWGASRLQKLGVSDDSVVPIPCWVERKDRTYHAALAVKRWFQQNYP